MFPGMEILACPNLAVPAQVMRHVVHVESSANPFAIGVVGAQLVRQPKTLEEAVATAKMLESGGYNYSLGAAQVNRVNFRKYGLDSHEKAFDLCKNLAAGASILANCYASAGGDWGKAFSCYYSGNFVTGFRHGYVQKVFDSINRGQVVAQAPSEISAIPLRAGSTQSRATPTAAAMPAAPARARAEAEQPSTAASRISMRVVPMAPSAPTAASVAESASSSPVTPVTPVVTSPAQPGAVARSDVFVPQVRLPSVGNAPATTAPAVSVDRPASDSAFVF
ncbi:MAG: lytic transglycosylase domain-containing protein [Hyphomicrobiales bacterium]|nr:MAG: lytic transglycosylase domain-containing protein [Hyphomicrobiales bacterium]